MNDDIRDCCDWPPGMLEVFHRCPHRAIRRDWRTAVYLRARLRISWLLAFTSAAGVYEPDSVIRRGVRT